MTGAGICKMSLVELGVLDASENPEASALEYCMNKLGPMIDTWSSWQDLIWYERTDLFTLQAGQLEYTIGPGGDFDMPRPIKIIGAQLRIESAGPQPVDYTIMEQSPSDYNEIGIKNVQAYPRQYGYNPEVPLAKMKFWPIPDQSYKVLLTSHMPFAVVTKNAELVAPPGILELIIYSLAVLVAPGFGVTPSVTTSNRATYLLKKIVQGNYSTLKRRVSPDESAPGFPEYTGVPYAWGYPP